MSDVDMSADSNAIKLGLPKKGRIIVRDSCERTWKFTRQYISDAIRWRFVEDASDGGVTLLVSRVKCDVADVRSVVSLVQRSHNMATSRDRLVRSAAA